jgi:dCMP deaminase
MRIECHCIAIEIQHPPLGAAFLVRIPYRKRYNVASFGSVPVGISGQKPSRISGRKRESKVDESREVRWDRRFMGLAKHVGEWSKDRSTKVGCVIVGPSNEIRAIGYNGFVRGADDQAESKHQRPDKYFWTEHAERNAIYHAAMIGVPLAGCRMYLPWFPCVDCARAIVQCGLAELIAYEPELSDPRWGKEFAIATEILKDAVLKVRFLKDPSDSIACGSR